MYTYIFRLHIVRSAPPAQSLPLLSVGIIQLVFKTGSHIFLGVHTSQTGKKALLIFNIIDPPRLPTGVTHFSLIQIPSAKHFVRPLWRWREIL